MKKIILFLMVVILCSFSVFAWGPNTHLNITQNCINNASDSLIKKVITTNLDACLSGLEYPDVGIFYYYTSQKTYEGLHSYAVVDSMLKLASNDKQRAFAYCYKIHLSEDAISHNFFVPNAILKTSMPNYWIHPIQELKIEGFYSDTRTASMMDHHSDYDAFFKQATGMDEAADAQKLALILGGSGTFYGSAYNPSTTNWFGQVQNLIYKGLTLVVNRQTGVDYYTAATQECQAVLRGETSKLDPAGHDALASANLQSSALTYIFTVLIFGALFILGWMFGIIGW